MTLHVKTHGFDVVNVYGEVRTRYKTAQQTALGLFTLLS
jgi:hypothetical protein